MRSARAGADAQPAAALELLHVSSHGMRALCEHFGAPPPAPLVPEGGCKSIRCEEAAGARSKPGARMFATGAMEPPDEARATLRELIHSGRIESCGSSAERFRAICMQPGLHAQ